MRTRFFFPFDYFPAVFSGEFTAGSVERTSLLRTRP